jgi:hypothetical protein
MYLAYVDEAGNTGRKLDDPDQPIHWLVSVLVPEDQVMALTHALDGVVARHVPDDPQRELHGAELFGGSGSWRGVAPTTRLAVYQAALATLAEHHCAIAHASVDKPMLQSWRVDASPHLIGLHFLMEKIDYYVRRQPEDLRQRALLVADETNEHESYAIDLLADLQRRGVGVFRGHKINNVIGTVHFVRSEVDRGVQAADLVAYGLCRLGNGRWNSPKPGDQALATMFGDHVTPLVRTFRERWPQH